MEHHVRSTNGDKLETAIAASQAVKGAASTSVKKASAEPSIPEWPLLANAVAPLMLAYAQRTGRQPCLLLIAARSRVGRELIRRITGQPVAPDRMRLHNVSVLTTAYVLRLCRTLGGRAADIVVRVSLPAGAVWTCRIEPGKLHMQAARIRKEGVQMCGRTYTIPFAE